MKRLSVDLLASLAAFLILPVASCQTAPLVSKAPKPHLPGRLFTPSVLAEARKHLKAGDRFPFFAATQFGDAKRAAKWIALPRSIWQDIIADHAPVALASARGRCPFCHKDLTGVTVDLARPLTGTTRCCGATIYADPAAMPKDYAARPNHDLKVLHPDARVYTYRFFVPDGAEDDTRQWFCPAGELWKARMTPLLLNVIPDLSARLLKDGDDDAALCLAVIFDRLAEVYPGLPFYDFTQPLGFEPGWESMTAETHGQRQDRWREPSVLWHGFRHRHTKLLDGTGYGDAGKTRHCGTLAEAYDLLRHHPVSAAYSQKQSGSASAFDERVMDKLFGNMTAWARQAQPFTGNMITVWFAANLRLAAMAGDRDLMQRVASLYDSYLHNHFYSDGLSIEAAFNYSAMLGYLFHEDWVAKELMGIDFETRVPLLKRIAELGDFPVVTLAGVESMHGDEHAQFFTSVSRPAPGKALNYEAHSLSQNFPDYGLSCLRAGAPGARLELIMDFQNTVLHAHPAALNLQLFYQGVNVLPDVGYNTGNANLKSEPWKGLKLPLELQEPSKLSNQVEMHNSGSALGSQFGHNSVVEERFLGVPDLPLQMVQAEGKWLYETNKWPKDASIPPVDVFNRQVATVTLPNGRAVALDFFRMKGGWRHDVYWHAPAESTLSSLGTPVELPEPSLLEHYQTHAWPTPGWMREATYNYHYYVEIRKDNSYMKGLSLITDPVAWQPDDQTWTMLWRIDPDRYAPVTPVGRAAYEPWSHWLKPVNLKLWGHASGSDTERSMIFGGKAPWAGHLEMGRHASKSRLALKDGLRVLVAHRQGSNADVESSFVHVLEPSTDRQQRALRAIDVRAALGKAAMGSVVDVTLTEGAKVLVAGSLAGGSVDDRAIQTDARLAVAMPGMATLTLFDGSRLKAGDIEAAVDPSADTELVRAIGDLSGQPHESALVVRSPRPLPLRTLLSGLTLHVIHQTGAAHISSYEIRSVSHLGGDHYRIDLRHTPPFIRRQLFVTSVKTRPGSTFLGTSHSIHDGIGRPYGLNRLLLFPRTGFHSSIKTQHVGGYAGWWSNGLEPADNPTAGEVRVGDLMIIYSVSAGDRVIIPSLLSCRPVAVAGRAVTCELVSSGDAQLNIGGQTLDISPGIHRLPMELNQRNADMIRHALAAAAAMTASARNAIAEPLSPPNGPARSSHGIDPAK